MYKLVMFDLDGTLLDSYDSIAKTLKDTLSHFGLEQVPDKEIETMIGPRVYDTFRNRFGRTHEESTEMTDWFRDDYVKEHLFDATLYPGIIELLKELKSKGFMTAIVTNKRYDYTEDLANHFGLTQYFDKVYGTDFKNTVQKHQLIERCLSELDVKKEDAVMIGDTHFDKDAAEKCDVDFIPVSYGFGKWDIKSCKNAQELLITLLS